MGRLCTAVLVALAGCGAARAGAGSTEGANSHLPDAAPGDSASAGAGGVGGSIDNSPDALTCGAQDFPLTRGLPPDLLIVLDRSGSMMYPGLSGNSKWTDVSQAVVSTVTALQTQVRWGIELFPTDNACGTGPIAVPVGDSNGPAIQAAIAAQGPNGNTPTRDAIHQAAAYLAALSDPNPKYILLATDGGPNCFQNCLCPAGYTWMLGSCCQMVGGALSCIYCPLGDSDGPGAAQAVADAAAMGVHTFVIGIATGSDEDDVLNALAQAGSEPRAGGPPDYYPVGTPGALVSVINAIAGQLASCTFPLTMTPPDPQLVGVVLDNQSVPRDPTHQDGWDFGPNNQSIILYGGWCQSVRLGTATQVRAVFGCPPVP
jgi:hypothetical protein